MIELLGTWFGLFVVVATLWWSWIVWRFVERTPLELRRIAAALESLIDLQRIHRAAVPEPETRSENGDGSGKGAIASVSQIESYGDLSHVGMLKKPKG